MSSLGGIRVTRCGARPSVLMIHGGPQGGPTGGAQQRGAHRPLPFAAELDRVQAADMEPLARLMKCGQIAGVPVKRDGPRPSTDQLAAMGRALASMRQPNAIRSPRAPAQGDA